MNTNYLFSLHANRQPQQLLEETPEPVAKLEHWPRYLGTVLTKSGNKYARAIGWAIILYNVGIRGRLPWQVEVQTPHPEQSWVEGVLAGASEITGVPLDDIGDIVADALEFAGLVRVRSRTVNLSVLLSANWIHDP